MKYSIGSEVYNCMGHIGNVIAYHDNMYVVEFEIEVDDEDGSFFERQLSYKTELELTDTPLKFIQHSVVKQLEETIVQLREDIKNLEARRGSILMAQLTSTGSLSLSYQAILKSLEDFLDDEVGAGREQKIKVLNELTKIVHKVDVTFGLIP